MIYDVAARSRRLAVGGVSLLLLGSATAVALAGSSAVPSPPRSALVPNAVAFRNDRNGVLGTGWEGCVDRAWHCRLQGKISVTSDGGKTWRVVRRMPSPVVYAAFFHDAYYVRLLNGVTYWADSAGLSWRRGHRGSFAGYCPKGWTAGTSSDFLDSNLTPPWSICVGEPGAGNQDTKQPKARSEKCNHPSKGENLAGLTQSESPEFRLVQAAGHSYKSAC